MFDQKEEEPLLDREIGGSEVTVREMLCGIKSLLSVILFVTAEMALVWLLATRLGVSHSAEAVPQLSFGIDGRTPYATADTAHTLNINVAAILTANAVWLLAWSIAMYFSVTSKTRLPFRAPAEAPEPVIWLFIITGFIALVRSARSVVPSLREVSFLSANILILASLAVAFLCTYAYVNKQRP
jgi:magnesium-transporting ATPase (P-type)